MGAGHGPRQQRQQRQQQQQRPPAQRAGPLEALGPHLPGAGQAAGSELESLRGAGEGQRETVGSQPSAPATPRRGVARGGRGLRTLRRASPARRPRAERPPGGGAGRPCPPVPVGPPRRLPRPRLPLPTPTAGQGGSAWFLCPRACPEPCPPGERAWSASPAVALASVAAPDHIMTTPACSLARTPLEPHGAASVVSVLWAPGLPALNPVERV